MLSHLYRDKMLDRFAREMDRLFEATGPAINRVLGEPEAGGGQLPGMNLWREGDDIIAELELPGFRMDDLEVYATSDSLNVRGRRDAGRPEDAAPLRIERSISSFERSVELPVSVDPDRTDASLRDGVLRITLPVAEVARRRRIEVRPQGGATNTALPGPGEQEGGRA